MSEEHGVNSKDKVEISMREVALRSHLKYLKAAIQRFGDIPRHTPTGLVWSERDGWHHDPRPRDLAQHGRSLADKRARQDEAMRGIRRVEALARDASPMAWKYCRQFAASGGRPSSNASDAEIMGYRLARAGYKDRPSFAR